MDSEEVFETTVDDGDVTVAAMTKKANRTLSTEVNIFGAADSRSNSEDHFVASRNSPKAGFFELWNVNKDDKVKISSHKSSTGNNSIKEHRKKKEHITRQFSLRKAL